MNSLKYAEQTDDPTVEPYEAAERSALQLWNALDDFRTSIYKGKKRKRTETDDVSTTTLWDRMELHEKHQAMQRKHVLEKVCLVTLLRYDAHTTYTISYGSRALINFVFVFSGPETPRKRA